MSATATLAHAAPSIPSGLRTSGHATPSHGSRSNTPMRIKRVIPIQLDAASAPLAADLDVGEEDRHVRRSNSAQTLESSAMHHHLSRARRRHLSVTTFCDKDAAACRDPSLTLLGGILARRQAADGPLRQSPSLSTITAASPIHALQMKLSEYAVLGPDASVALAYSQIMDPAVQCVVISIPGTAHVLTREELSRLARYCHDPHSDTLGGFLAGKDPTPALLPSATVATAAGLLLQKRQGPEFLALVSEGSFGGGAGGGDWGNFLGLVSRTDVSRVLLGDCSGVYDTTGSVQGPSPTVSRDAAMVAIATAALAGEAPLLTQPPPAAAAAVTGSSPTRGSGGGCGASVCTVTSSTDGGAVHDCAAWSVSELRPDIPHRLHQHSWHHMLTSTKSESCSAVPSPQSPLPPPPMTQQKQHSSAPIRVMAATAAAAVATATAVAPSTAAVPQLQQLLGYNHGGAQEPHQGPLQQLPQKLRQFLLHEPLSMGPKADATAATTMDIANVDVRQGDVDVRQGNSVESLKPQASIDQQPVAAEGLRTFTDHPIKSGWDILDNVDDALDVLGLVGRSVNAEAVGRKLLGDMMGAAANIAGGSSGTGWFLKYLYDGDCNICRTFQAILEKLDNGMGRVIFVDISSQAFNPLEHGGINYKAAMETIHILSANGQVFKGVTAVIKLLAAVDPEIANKMGVLTTVLPLLSLGYLVISKNRHALSGVWGQLLRLTKADRALFGRDISISIPTPGASHQPSEEKRDGRRRVGGNSEGTTMDYVSSSGSGL